MVGLAKVLHRRERTGSRGRVGRRGWWRSRPGAALLRGETFGSPGGLSSLAVAMRALLLVETGTAGRVDRACSRGRTPDEAVVIGSLSLPRESGAAGPRGSLGSPGACSFPYWSGPVRSSPVDAPRQEAGARDRDPSAVRAGAGIPARACVAGGTWGLCAGSLHPAAGFGGEEDRVAGAGERDQQGAGGQGDR